MEEEFYYIHINGAQKGPIEKQHLLSEGLRPETMVWRQGLDEWVEASSLPELEQLFAYNANYGNPYGQSDPGYPYSPGGSDYTPPQGTSYGPPPHGNPYGQPGYGYPEPPRNPYNGYNRGNMVPGAYPPGWTNWLGWAIAATVLGLFGYLIMAIPGIVGIVKANEANSLARMGDPRAFSVNSTAKAWTLVGLIINGILILIGIFALIIFGVAIMGLAGAAAY